jgi:hypothetical protein
MHFLKIIFGTILQLAQQVWLIPQMIVTAVKQRRQCSAFKVSEIERLDRIRDPNKYLGK